MSYIRQRAALEESGGPCTPAPPIPQHAPLAAPLAAPPAGTPAAPLAAPPAGTPAAPLAALPPRPGASPGLLRRRYSVPETIMRKYRLAQQRSYSEESVAATSPSPASASPARGGGGGGGGCGAACGAACARREQVRREALLRRACAACCCAAPASRSLDGSRVELRPLSGLCSPRSPRLAAGWGSPKRQRLDSPRDFRGSDEMIRAAMRNSYDRTEEARCERAPRPEPSESTYTTTDCDTPFDVRCERNGFAQYSDSFPSEPTAEVRSDFPDNGLESEFSASNAQIDDDSYADTSDAFSTSASTAKENGSLRYQAPKQTSRSAHIDGRISERSASVDNDQSNVLPYDTPLTVDTPSYDLLEIVVSETSNSDNVPVLKSSPPKNTFPQSLKVHPVEYSNVKNINIDEYVSNILVESLNSLTDQLECMNASIGNDRKINIVEKEIKVKLQNTGVNTIVHLSPTSNNQIIFGNEELCNNDGGKDICNNPQEASDAAAIREETASEEFNNNPPAPRHDAVNNAVLQQIQKLFQDELEHLASAVQYPLSASPGISHIEISNVDVYIDNNSDVAFENSDTIEMHTQNDANLSDLISGVGAGNYFEDLGGGALVPRFTAFPHTDSMEVNTSSSDDAEVGGSDCTSLVDSLDDPNSPRSLLLRRSFNNNNNNNGRRSELVRSAIDVLDLLPEDAMRSELDFHKEKGESFFIRIKDDDCDCEKENVIVADHMPETIKQRLYRRHRRRELRMEVARRARPPPPHRTQPPPRRTPARPRRAAERECRALLDALIDEVIAKIAQDEYKCMRIKQKPSRMIISKSEENVSKRCCKRDVEYFHKKEAFKLVRTGSTEPPKERRSEREPKRSERHQIRGKLSLLTHPIVSPDDRGPKRIYQKSEIHEGNKCIEILEILEYVNGSQSSPETTNSDENHNLHYCKGRKSRIPVPVSERVQKTPRNCLQKYYTSSERVDSPPSLRDERRRPSDRLTNSPSSPSPESPPPAPAPRRASIPPQEPRSRSNSLRFRRVFDSIPEERSLSIDSSNDDANHNRRASAPNVTENLNYHHNISGTGRPGETVVRSGVNVRRKDSSGTSTETKSTATSPPTTLEANLGAQRRRSQTTMTSPQQRSAATSPHAPAPAPAAAPAPAPAAAPAPPPRAPAPPPRAARPPPGPKEAGGATVEVDSVAARYERELAAARAGLLGGDPGPRLDDGKDIKPKKPTDRSKSESRYRKVPKTTERGTHTSAEVADTRTRAVKLPGFKLGNGGGGGAAGAGDGGAASSDSSDSSSSLLCALAPRWLAGTARARRRRRDAPPAQRAPPAPAQAVAVPPPLPEPPASSTTAPNVDSAGGWSVTVAGSSRAALPADLEMRLRFPHERAPRGRPRAASPASTDQDCWCSVCRRACRCGCVCAPLSPPHAPHTQHPRARAQLAAPDQPPGKFTLTMKKEATDSSILASKSMKKSADPLPDLETYKASRSKTRSSVKTRRGYSLHCWLPDDAERAPLRTSNGLSVLGCAIIPELKPRVPTMSERDLTRAYTPRHYLRS